MRAIMQMKWNKDFETGIEVIDNQHRNLIEKANEIFHGLETQGGSELILDAAKFYQEYVLTHFDTEVEFMTQYEYPGKEIHVAEHQKLMSEFIELKTILLKDGLNTVLGMRIQKFIGELLEHFLRFDRKMGFFIKSKLVTETVPKR